MKTTLFAEEARDDVLIDQCHKIAGNSGQNEKTVLALLICKGKSCRRGVCVCMYVRYRKGNRNRIYKIYLWKEKQQSSLK